MAGDDVFDARTADYDAWYDSGEGKPLFESELRCLAPMIRNAPPPILEVGVGTGRFAMRFTGPVGVDLSSGALNMAKARGVRAVRANAEKLPFGDGTFGCVLLIVTLCFVKEPVEVLKEARRVLKAEGSLIVGLVHGDSSWGAYYKEKKKKGHPYYERASFYTFKELSEMLAIAGFGITRARSTLLQKPDDARSIEEPVEGYVEEAGFLGVEAKWRNHEGHGASSASFPLRN